MTSPRLLTFALALACLVSAAPADAKRPDVGEFAPKLLLPGLDGTKVDLAKTFRDQKTVLVVLRGYPGYQCGICSRQASGFIALGQQFVDADLQVVMVYPGPAANLEKHAEEFLAEKDLPASFTILLDPDYEFTNLYDLRWDAPNETAYPATYVVEKGGKISFAKVSNGHGGRVEAQAALTAATAATE